MATMNPVDLYHDPALDDLIPVAKLPYRNGSTNQRTGHASQRSMSDGHSRSSEGIPSALAVAPRGPPISYRGVGPHADPGLHRSFSQRAKGRPFADEAFLDDDTAEGRSARRPQGPTNPDPAEYDASPQLQPQPFDESNQLVHEQKSRPQRHRKEASVSTTTSQSRPQHEQVTRPPAEPRTPGVRSTIPAEQGSRRTNQRSNWANDRSPLQKLEVKLTDISKEEKRARVQEAEMKFLRDNEQGTAPKRSRPSKEATTHPVQGVMTAITSPIVQPPGLAQPPDMATTMPKPASRPARDSLTSAPSHTRRVSLDSSGANRRTSSERYTPSESELQSVQPQVARAVSLQQQKPRIRYRNEDRPATQHERNASHQAALEQLTGARPERPKRLNATQDTTVAGTARAPASRSTQSKRSPVAGDQDFVASPPAAAPPPPMLNKQTEAKQFPPMPVAKLGLQQPRALRSVDSPPASLTDVSKHRQRKSSVSFKDPFDRRRPVDEWRNAVTARLTIDDFQTHRIEQAEVKAGGHDADAPWWEKSPSQARRANRARAGSASAAAATAPATAVPPTDERTSQFSPRLHLKCGPLLRYTGLKRIKDDTNGGSTEKEFWRGTIMIVTQDSQCSYDEFPVLRLFSQPKKLLPPPPTSVQGDQLAPEYIDPIAGLTKLGRTGKTLYVRPVDHLDVEKDLSRIEDDNGLYESSPSPLDGVGHQATTSAATNKRTLDGDGESLGRFKEVAGVRIYADPDRDVTFWRFSVEIELGVSQQHIGYRINKGAAMGFWVPAKGQTMNIMFHSCNGFSTAVNSNEFSGPDPLWRDVMNNHQTRPFHVMIGGGDQIYNDRVTVDTHWFAGWTKIKNPHHKHQAPFTTEMKEELESFYLERYCMWFSQGLFALANSSIPMVNIWDDHDIIDGFGSYPHEFMKTPVFSGLGNIAFKYYMLFQHQSIDLMTDKDEPSWVMGHAPGPYISTKSRSVFLELGQSVAFLGIDCRTERTKNDVMSIDTLELILDRCRRDMVEGRTKHLIVLLGVPIAYPRLVWLENVLTSRAMDPLKALSRAGILKPGLLNKFDGGVEILDDLDDHWTASHHKDERHVLIEELQDLAAEKSARITILSGDVHLAAVGQFYSNPRLKIPKDRDHRYMPNIISSAIVNAPPPDLMADIINKRNKIHHLDKYTDENMIPMFTHDVDHKRRNNNHLLPRRNWCSIREYFPGETPPPSPSLQSVVTEEDGPPPVEHEENWDLNQPPKRRLSITKADFNPIALVRRLSSRRAPPSAYRDDPEKPQQLRSASLDGSLPRQEAPQVDGSSQQMRASSMDRIVDVRALRPSFHRRPTNLSKKAARKGLVPAIDADGNEVDVNDHINLEGGLDVVINCEVDRKYPFGITLPYRVLIPALHYDGSSDREKFEETTKPSRRATVLNKFGLGIRPANKTNGQKSAEDWDDGDDDNESHDGVEGDNRPQRSFSFFGSRRRKDTKQIGMPNEGTNHPYQQAASQPAQSHAIPSASANSDNNALEKQDPIPAAPRSLVPPKSHEQPYPRSTARQVTENGSSQTSRRSRPASYTIGGATSANAQIPSPQPHEQFFESQPYDADASYLEDQQRSLQTKRQEQQQQQRQQSESSTEHIAVPHRDSSKRARVADHGLSPESDQASRQTQLRGNGILGKNLPPSSFRSKQEEPRPGSSNSDSSAVRGYSGIDAYREPREPGTRRRWSLSIRDKARGLIDSLDGRGRKDRSDLYADDDEEEFWEGPKQDYHQDQVRQQRHQQTEQQRVPEKQQQHQSHQNAATQQPRAGGYRQWGPTSFSGNKGRASSNG